VQQYLVDRRHAQQELLGSILSTTAKPMAKTVKTAMTTKTTRSRLMTKATAAGRTTRANSILLDLAAASNVFVGSRVYEFLSDEEIVRYESRMGPN